MLNYIKAELWKVLHRRGVYVLLALLLLCTALFFMLYSYGGFSSLAKGISVTMVVGMLAAPLLVQLVDGGTADTLKNELSFGSLLYTSLKNVVNWRYLTKGGVALQSKKKTILAVAALVAVSYTHLDVYKRQVPRYGRR